MNEVNVFILGSKGYQANYGGWETFVHGLSDNWNDSEVRLFIYGVAEKENEESIVKTGNTTCIDIYVKNTGSSTMIHYDVKCLRHVLGYISENRIKNPVILFLGMRIGPLVWLKKPYIKSKGVYLICNPDGMEWKRTKWNPLVQVYLYTAARFMAAASDLLVCDSKCIMDIYSRDLLTKRVGKEYIPYGSYPCTSETEKRSAATDAFFEKWGIREDEYYLILGRYTPENNYEMMLKGFMASDSKRNLLVITNYAEEKQSFHVHIRKSTGYEQDPRVKMVGSVYDKELTQYIRRHAHGYIHGHSVGGTNPGLLEAMSSTDVNILYDCECNREVGDDAVMYFRDADELKRRIEQTDDLSGETICEYGKKAKERMRQNYAWVETVRRYDSLFHKVSGQDKYVNILLLGCDVIWDISERENPTEREKTMRSDAMVIVSINKATAKIRLVSLMRDVWVNIPGHGMGKLNAPVVYGGPELAVKVINDSFGLNIEKYIRINISNTIELVDSIGGVDIELTDEEAEYIDEWIPNIRIISKREDEVEPLRTGGMRHLNGMQAVAHARNRTLGASMKERENRTNEVFKAIVNKVKSQYSLPQIILIAKRSLKYVKTNIGIPEGLGLIRYGLKADFHNVETYHAPEEGTYEVKRDGTWRMEVDFDKASEKMQEFMYTDR